MADPSVAGLLVEDEDDDEDEGFEGRGEELEDADDISDGEESERISHGMGESDRPSRRL